MSVIKWQFVDPESLVATYTFEINPSDETPGLLAQLQKNQVYAVTTGVGLPLLFEKTDNQPTATATGTILTQDQFLQFNTWFNLQRPFQLLDDLGNAWIIYPTQFTLNPGRKRSINFPWRTDYQLNYLVLGASYA